MCKDWAELWEYSRQWDSGLIPSGASIQIREINSKWLINNRVIMMSNCWEEQAAVKASGGGESGLWLKEALAGEWVRAKSAAKVLESRESPGSQKL